MARVKEGFLELIPELGSEGKLGGMSGKAVLDRQNTGMKRS